ncbi:MAG: glycosyltransferase [Patescibacteria group bacterium]|nr:glycosyltransferase [Patescibacteria group bacterium]
MKKIALVHDFLQYWGGAETTLDVVGNIFPDAPIFTLLQDENLTKKHFQDKDIQVSFLQKAPNFLKKRHKYLFPLMPTAVETFNLRDFDVVISSSSAFAKGIIVKPKTTHICYMHAPMRYVWDWHHEYMQEQRLGNKVRLLTRFFLNYLRMWDRASSERVDYFVANSKYTSLRIKKYYRRNSKVIYPPVKVDNFVAQKENGGFFLAVGRLSAYKRIKLIVEVFNKLKLPLVVVGDGQLREELEKMTERNKNIKILGWLPADKLRKLYSHARAFVCACEDDFNITVVEAMASGKPVVALRRGGVMETVQEHVTGEFFDAPQVEIVADGIRRFIENENSYDYEKIRARAEEFSEERFKKEFKEYVEEVTNEE